MKKEFVAQFGNTQITALNAAVVTGKLQQLASGFIYNSTTTASATPGKFNTTKEAVTVSSHKFDLLEELLEGNQRANTLIVYNFQEELAQLKQRYPHAVTLDDKNAIERWNKGEIELLLLHPKSAGHGINLQYGGNKIVFVSIPWSLELYEQTVGRLHRSGQAHEVWCYILLTNKTVDERIWASLHDKQALSTLAMEELRCN